VTSNIRAASVRPFQVDFDSVAWYPNHDNTRWFLSLSAVKPPNNELNRLLDSSNKTAKSSQLPTLYLREDTVSKKKKGMSQKQPDPGMEPLTAQDIPDCSDAFHVSLAWSLTKPSDIAFNQAVTTNELKQLSIRFDSVKVKIGNILTSVELLSKVTKPRGSILG
jgi:hypothetical protein